MIRALLVDSIPDVVLIFDVETLLILDVNRDEEGAFGYGRDELLRLDAFALFSRWWDAAKTMEPGTSVATLLKKRNGVEIPVDVRFARAKHGQKEVLVAAVRGERPLSEIERELAETNTYLHAIVENIPDMIFVKDADTHIFKRFNRAGEELLGFTRGELLGKTDHDFYPKDQADFFHQKDDETMASGRIVDIPSEPIQTKYLGERILHTRKIPIFDPSGKPLYLLGISEDITERIKAEQVAREFADVVRYLRDAVVTWRPEGQVVSWNPGAERLFGVSAGEAIGRPFERFVPDGELLPFRKKQAAILSGQDVDVEEVIRLRADGREIEVEESLFAVFDERGRLQRIAHIGRDLSELSRWRRATQVLNAAHGAMPATDFAASPEMREALRCADLVASDAIATVLILGETGVGKSWLARRIHHNSPRADKPFFEINCAGLGVQLVESELFGHERGAFTGATSQKRGLVETAEGGTLFLDEIGELSPSVQAQLLTFIDTRTFRRVGATRTLTADVRLLAATNADLKRGVEEGRFRRDLYYRLSVVPIVLPPLRHRPDEIPGLTETILAELTRRSGRPRTPISRQALIALQRHRWPGNIRELRNTLERALILSNGAAIGLDQLPPELRFAQNGENHTDEGGAFSLDKVQHETIAQALKDTNGNRTQAARLLGISRSTLKRKLAEMRKA